MDWNQRGDRHPHHDSHFFGICHRGNRGRAATASKRILDWIMDRLVARVESSVRTKHANGRNRIDVRTARLLHLLICERLHRVVDVPLTQKMSCLEWDMTSFLVVVDRDLMFASRLRSIERMIGALDSEIRGHRRLPDDGTDARPDRHLVTVNQDWSGERRDERRPD